VALAVSVVLLGVPGRAEVVDAPPPILVLPFANLTGMSEGASMLSPRFYERLEGTEVRFVSDEELRPLLREHRIRSRGEIGSQDAEILRSRTGARAALLGSWDIYEPGENPEVAVSARLLDLDAMVVVDAWSVALSGDDEAGLFAIGRVEEMEPLAGKVLDLLFEKLTPALRAPARTAESEPPLSRVAVVAFDNVSAYDRAGDVASNILLSELVAHGFTVVEPGFVNEVLIDERARSKGAIDLGTLEALRARAEIDLLVTGVVERFEPARGEEGVPELSVGARVLDAAAGRLVLAFDEEHSGRDAQTILGMGRHHSLGRLAGDVVRRFVERVDEKREKLLAAENRTEGPHQAASCARSRDGRSAAVRGAAANIGDGDRSSRGDARRRRGGHPRARER
jgi:hypothetical protein